MRYWLFLALFLNSCAYSYKLGVSYIKEETREEFNCQTLLIFAVNQIDKHFIFDCDGKRVHVLIREKVK